MDKVLDGREVQTGGEGGTLGETAGAEILFRSFTARGLEIQRDVPFEAAGVALNLDGYDPRRRIGYEFITTEAGDRETFTPEVIERLEERMAAGEYHLLLVDEAGFDADTLVRAAEGFLDRLERLGILMGQTGC